MKLGKELRSVIQSFKYAFEGISYVFTSQRNMQIHLGVAIIVLLLSFLLKIPKYQLLLVFFTIVFVMCMELVNTAIEKTVDLVTDKFHPLAKIAKDVAAGAVLLAAIFAFMIGLYVFVNPLLALFSIQVHYPIDQFFIIGILGLLVSFVLKRATFIFLFIMITFLIAIIIYLL